MKRLLSRIGQRLRAIMAAAGKFMAVKGLPFESPEQEQMFYDDCQTAFGIVCPETTSASERDIFDIWLLGYKRRHAFVLPDYSDLFLRGNWPKPDPSAPQHPYGRILSKAAQDVLAERERQVSGEGWTTAHDDGHDSGELAAAASAYALYAADELHPHSQGDGQYKHHAPNLWPWHPNWWKPTDPRRALVKSAALALAELERHDRLVVGMPGVSVTGGFAK